MSEDEKARVLPSGSYIAGLGYVPCGEYCVELHMGERVLTAVQAKHAENKGDEHV